MSMNGHTLPGEWAETATSPKPSVSTMLRQLADSIDRGEIEGVEAALVLLPLDGGYPRVLGFGDMTGVNEPMIQFDLAKQWMLGNLVQRG